MSTGDAEAAPDAPDECSICRGAEGDLVFPCACSAPVHAACLREWVSFRADALFPLLLAEGGAVCGVCRCTYDGGVLGRKAGTFLSVEGCLLLFLLVLAVMGHVLFLMGVYKGGGSYVIEKGTLAVVNAVLTGTLLVCVQKAVSRWLRESEMQRGGGTLAQVALGVGLSGVAGCEIFLLLSNVL